MLFLSENGSNQPIFILNDDFDFVFVFQHEENPIDYNRILLHCYSVRTAEGIFLEPFEIVELVDKKLSNEMFSYLPDHHKQSLRLVWRNDKGIKNSKVYVFL
jgi:hypothetical protein